GLHIRTCVGRGCVRTQPSDGWARTVGSLGGHLAVACKAQGRGLGRELRACGDGEPPRCAAYELLEWETREGAHRDLGSEGSRRHTGQFRRGRPRLLGDVRRESASWSKV